MRDIFAVFYDKRQIRFILPTAIVYVALLMPFKSLVIVPGFTEVRPANFIPALFGVLFGPAAAWGSAFGNLIADIASALAMGPAGTFSLGSIFGFAGNFVFAYAAYRVWSLLDDKNDAGDGISPLQAVYFLVAGLIGSILCAIIISLGLLLLGLQNLPQSVFMTMFIAINNFIPVAVLGTLGLWLFYEKVKKAGWLCRPTG